MFSAENCWSDGMARLGIALDLGTSGFRGQAIDLDQNGRILCTAITTRHPFPGANVIDHLHFALEVGIDKAHEVIIHAVNKVLDNLAVDKDQVVRLAVCGNPIQLSLFQGIEIRDLAYAGKRKLEALGVVTPKRNARIIKALEISGLALPAQADILVPPAVRHEIGADALAMMIQTGMLEKDEISIVTDYGTNAEMALIVKGVVYTGSTAAGPALEGQQIEDGILALPGAISDVQFEPDEDQAAGSTGCVAGGDDKQLRGRLKTNVLDQEMMPRLGDTVDPNTGKVTGAGELRAVGITGTGVIALLSQGLKARLIRIPRINTPDTEIHLPDGLKFTEEDLIEAGKAIGAIRAGHITLCNEAGIRLEDIEIAYMSGASGTYVDALKALEIGMVPARVKKIYQVGNTSLAMAADVIKDVDNLWKMQEIADNLRQNHCMFAESKVFEKVYILELSYWTEGMPRQQYQKFLTRYGLPTLVDVADLPEVIKTVKRDIPDLGVMGLKIISDIGQRKTIVFDGCLGDAKCVVECPEKALQMKRRGDNFEITINMALCNGVACMRCERVCKEKTFDLISLLTC
jgi:methylamine methyltransferase corrinoid protein reductive activase